MEKNYNYENTVCRTFLCERCKKNQQPKIGTIVTTFGTESQALLPFKIDYVPRKTIWGLTPHLIIYPNTIEKGTDFINFEIVCGINGCGIEWKFDGKKWSYIIIQISRHTLPRNQFEAMIKYKDPDFYVLE